MLKFYYIVNNHGHRDCCEYCIEYILHNATTTNVYIASMIKLATNHLKYVKNLIGIPLLKKCVCKMDKGGKHTRGMCVLFNEL